MEKNELKVEETFLQKALDGKVQVRLSLTNRERLACVVSNLSRYDINIDSDGSVMTLPKKEVSYISCQQPLLEEGFFKEAPAADPAASRSKVQDEYLARFVREKTLTLLRLVNGDELRGVLDGFDGFTIALRTSRGQVLLYKHGLCSISPGYRRRKENENVR